MKRKPKQKNENGIHIKVKRHQCDCVKYMELADFYLRRTTHYKKRCEELTHKQKQVRAKSIITGGLIIGIIWLISLI